MATVKTISPNAPSTSQPTVPVLDLLHLDTYNCSTIGIADTSTYPAGWNIVSPTMTVTLPYGAYTSLPFTPNSVNIYNSLSLKVTCEGEDIMPLPDGIYQFKYVINPPDNYSVNKTILKTSCIQEKLDNIWLKLDMNCQADPQVKKLIQEIDLYLGEATAAANVCALDLSITLYRRAQDLIAQYERYACACK